jgi:hypothetical protein
VRRRRRARGSSIGVALEASWSGEVHVRRDVHDQDLVAIPLKRTMLCGAALQTRACCVEAEAPCPAGRRDGRGPRRRPRTAAAAVAAGLTEHAGDPDVSARASAAGAVAGCPPMAGPAHPKPASDPACRQFSDLPGTCQARRWEVGRRPAVDGRAGGRHRCPASHLQDTEAETSQTTT